jgi:transposase
MEKEPQIDWKERYHQLLEKIAVLEARIATLEADNLALRSENLALKAENRDLREKLNTSSGNSSKPPSQDPFRKTRSNTPSGKKPGGQPGHEGHKRKTYPPEKVTKTIDLKPVSCPNCSSGQFDEMPVSIDLRQVIELPNMPPEITQYNIHTCRCGHCGKHVRADVPKEAERGFGPRLMGFVTMLTGEGHVTKRKICTLASHLGLKISLGALCNIHKLASIVLEEPSQAIHKHVMEQGHVNGDESGWRLRRKRYWIWIGATRTAAVFRIDPSRSHEAFKRIFHNFTGTLTTDRHGAYNDHEGSKQTCLAHIKRDFEKVSERPEIDGSCGRILQEQLGIIFSLWAEFKKGSIVRTTLQAKAEEPIENIRVTLMLAAQNAKNSKTVAFACNILDRFPTLWTFLYQEGVEPTNNLAERGLRPAVIFRKLSGGSQSEWGLRFIERLMTVVCTLKQNTGNVFEFLTKSFQAHFGARSPPSLLLQ